MPKRSLMKRGLRMARSAVKAARKYVPAVDRVIRQIPKPLRRTISRATRPRRHGGSSGLDLKQQVAPVQYMYRANTGVPSMNQVNGGVVIAHTEMPVFNLDVQTSSAVIPVDLVVNPNNASLHPWLAEKAVDWSRYVVKRLAIRYVPLGNMTQNGTIYIAATGDPDTETPLNYMAMMSFKDSCSFSINSIGTLDISLPTLTNQPKFNNTLPVDGLSRWTDGDPSLAPYVATRIWVACANCDVGAKLGSFYVDYSYLLLDASQSASEADINRSLYYRFSDASVSLANPFGDPSNAAYAPIKRGRLAISAKTDTVTVNLPGDYLISLFYSGTVLTATLPAITPSVHFQPDDAHEVVSSVLRNAANTIGTVTYLVRVRGPGATIEFDFTASAATITLVRFYVARYGSKLDA